MSFKNYLATSILAIGLSVGFFACSNPIKDLGPEVRRKVLCYEEVFKKMPKENREDFVKLLEQGLRISESQHKKDLNDIIKASEDYQKSGKKWHLILLSDDGYAEYKNRTFNSNEDVKDFLLWGTQEYALVYHSSKNNSLIIEYGESIQPVVRRKVSCIDYKANGMYSGEDDFFYVTRFIPSFTQEEKGEVLGVNICMYENMIKGPFDLMERDASRSAYKITVSKVAKMLKNQMDLEYLDKKCEK